MCTMGWRCGRGGVLKWVWLPVGSWCAYSVPLISWCHESLVLWSHDIGAAVLWIMINECQVYDVCTFGNRDIILVLYDGQTAALMSNGYLTCV